MKVQFAKTYDYSSYYPFSYNKNLQRAKELYSPNYKSVCLPKANKYTPSYDRNLATLMKKYMIDYNRIQKLTYNAVDNMEMPLDPNDYHKSKEMIKQRISSYDSDFIDIDIEKEFEHIYNDESKIKGKHTMKDYDRRMKLISSQVIKETKEEIIQQESEHNENENQINNKDIDNRDDNVNKDDHQDQQEEEEQYEFHDDLEIDNK